MPRSHWDEGNIAAHFPLYRLLQILGPRDTIGTNLHDAVNNGPWTLLVTSVIIGAALGALFGFGARLARGCTSGVALTGGASLAAGSWVTMLCIFAGAYGLAWFVRRLWI